MKNFRRQIAFLLVVVMMAAALATAVSAEKVLFKTIGTQSAAKAPAAAAKTDDVVEFTGNVFVRKVGMAFYLPASPDMNWYDPDTVFVENPYAVKEAAKNSAGISFVGKYLSGDDAAKALSKYFSTNSLTITMKVGETRTLGASAYMFSDNPAVAEFNGVSAITAKAVGKANMYVFTGSGIPYYCLKINVVSESSIADNLILKVSKSNLKIGETADVTVVSASGTEYKDIEYTIRTGSARATVSADGKVTAVKNGVVIVRAASKAHPEVYGDAILYIGQLYGAIADGCWKTVDGKINVSAWCGCFDYLADVCGWVENEDGLYIPVIGITEGVIKSYRGTTTGKIIYGDLLTIQKYIELYSKLSGDNKRISTLVGRYAYEFGEELKDGTAETTEFDNRTILLARMIDKFVVGK